MICAYRGETDKGDNGDDDYSDYDDYVKDIDTFDIPWESIHVTIIA